MSYILDALRKSESERQQGRIPDLGQQVQLIHKPRRKGIPALVWVALALVLNALVLAAVFWPGASVVPVALTPESPAEALSQMAAAPASQLSGEPAPTRASTGQPPEPAGPIGSEAGSLSVPESNPTANQTQVPRMKIPEQPTVIVPSWKLPAESGQIPPDAYAGVPQNKASAFSARVPHLVELPMSFQKRVPTLMFNSHIYASDPAARRVMINDSYLRTGESFSGIRVEDITVDGVVLSLDGQRFRVGVVRDWISPR